MSEYSGPTADQLAAIRAASDARRAARTTAALPRSAPTPTADDRPAQRALTRSQAGASPRPRLADVTPTRSQLVRRVLRNKVAFKSAALLVGLAYGVAAAGLYYAGLETIPAVTRTWHHLVPNSPIRHAMRGGVEGFAFRVGSKSQSFNPRRQSFLRRKVIAPIEHGLAGHLFFAEPGQRGLTRHQKTWALASTPLFMAAGGAGLYFLAKYAVSGIQVSQAWQHMPKMLQSELVSKQMWVGRAVGFGMHLGMYPTRALRAERFERKQDRLRPRAEAGTLELHPWRPGAKARQVAINAAARGASSAADLA